MICPGEVAATKSSGVWQGWEVARTITKQVIVIMNNAMFLSHLLTSCKFLGIVKLAEYQHVPISLVNTMYSIGQCQGPESLCIQIFDDSQNSSSPIRIYQTF